MRSRHERRSPTCRHRDRRVKIEFCGDAKVDELQLVALALDKKDIFWLEIQMHKRRLQNAECTTPFASTTYIMHMP